jgi:hypothetical protein
MRKLLKFITVLFVFLCINIYFYGSTIQAAPEQRMVDGFYKQITADFDTIITGWLSQYHTEFTKDMLDYTKGRLMVEYIKMASIS